MPKNEMLQVRISEVEKEKLEELSRNSNMSISSFVRSRVFTEDDILEGRIADLTELVKNYAYQLKELKIIRDEEYTLLKKLLAVLILHEADTEDIFTELEEVRIEKECLNVQSLIQRYRETGRWT